MIWKVRGGKTGKGIVAAVLLVALTMLLSPVAATGITAPPEDQPQEVQTTVSTSLWNWVDSFLGQLSISGGGETYQPGESFSVSWSMLVPNHDTTYDDGSYERMYGTWVVLDGAGNQVQWKGSYKEITGTSTWKGSATLKAQKPTGTHYFTSFIVKKTYTYDKSSNTWTVTSETVAAKDGIQYEVKEIGASPSQAPTGVSTVEPLIDPGLEKFLPSNMVQALLVALAALGLYARGNLTSFTKVLGVRLKPELYTYLFMFTMVGYVYVKGWLPV